MVHPHLRPAAEAGYVHSIWSLTPYDRGEQWNVTSGPPSPGLLPFARPEEKMGGDV
jgi:hypothetical protein